MWLGKPPQDGDTAEIALTLGDLPYLLRLSYQNLAHLKEKNNIDTEILFTSLPTEYCSRKDRLRSNEDYILSITVKE
ncbi:hypothetical protein TNCV_1242231 [Trichonephila clavipes]|nr:hypothetical protein TNCV_1242231 [Trichonephila clavipes]